MCTCFSVTGKFWKFQDNGLLTGPVTFLQWGESICTLIYMRLDILESIVGPKFCDQTEQLPPFYLLQTDSWFYSILHPIRKGNGWDFNFPWTNFIAIILWANQILADTIRLHSSPKKILLFPESWWLMIMEQMKHSLYVFIDTTLCSRFWAILALWTDGCPFLDYAIQGEGINCQCLGTLTL